MTFELLDLDHVGISVPDLDEGVETYRRLLRVEPVHRLLHRR